MIKYHFNIYSHSDLIGYSDLEKSDASMGVAFGDFIPSENYKSIEDKIKESIEKNDFSALGLSATDSITGQTIENYFIAIFPPPKEFKNEAIEVTVNGIPYPQYGHLFPHHVEAEKAHQKLLHDSTQEEKIP